MGRSDGKKIVNLSVFKKKRELLEDICEAKKSLWHKNVCPPHPRSLNEDGFLECVMCGDLL